LNNSRAFLAFYRSSGCNLCNGKQVLLASDPNDGLVIEREPYAFPSYEQAVQATDVEKYSSQQAYEKAVSDSHLELQKLRYMSDGLKVAAYLYKPREV
jgi:hypothetical protein